MDDVVQPNRKRLWVICVLSVIIAAGLAGGGVYYWQQQQLSNTKSSDQGQINDLNIKVGSLTKQLDTANTKIKTLSQPTAPATPTVDDKTAITNVVTADCEAAVGYQISNINIVTLASPYADTTLVCLKRGEVGGTLRRILERVSDQWVIIDRPTNGIDSATRQNYGIPSTIQ